jgi:hypothetical protein
MKVDLLEGPKMVLLISNPLSKAATTVNFPSPSETDHVLFLFIFLTTQQKCKYCTIGLVSPILHVLFVKH